MEKDEKDGGLPGTKGVGRRAARCRDGVERAPAYTLRIIYWHWIYLKLCYTEAAIVLLRPALVSSSPSCHRSYGSYYDRVRSLSLYLALVFSSLARPLLIPAVSFSFPLSYDSARLVWPTGRHNSRSLPPKYLMRHAIFTISTPWQSPALKA
jgi:hypothetical protein